MPFEQETTDMLRWDPFEQYGEEGFVVAAGDEKHCNAMTISWGGFGVWWEKKVATIYVRENRYTKTFLDTNEYFTLSALSEDYRKEKLWFGLCSGREHDKFKETGLTPYPVEGTVGIAEADLIIVCKKILRAQLTPETFVDLKARSLWYAEKEEGNFHTMYIGEIVKILQSDEAVMF